MARKRKPAGETSRPARAGVDIDPKMLDLLVCPLTKEVLHYDRDRNELVSHGARLAYPVRDGIPIMLPSEARQLDDEEA